MKQSKQIQIPDFPEYTFTCEGRVYKNGKEKTVSKKEGRSAKVIIRRNNKMYTLGLATLIAEHFIPNPFNHKRVIFKDRNNHHCTKENIAWVDDETHFFYCCPYSKRGRPKITHSKEYALKHAKDANLLRFYGTGDEYWLNITWNEIDKNMSELKFWPRVMSACYLHFIERANRYSILGNPSALMWYYAKSEYYKFKKEISTDIPFKKLVQTDESLRNKRMPE